ncbi:MAG: TlyA family RNA methyltransferase [Bdellovibrionales bacterium]
MRLDQLLVDRKLARSRGQAKELIFNGLVSVNGEVVHKASTKVALDSLIQLKENGLTDYVSRAGIKLKNASDRLGVSFEGKTVLDIGQSTGGFTDFVLQSGAVSVVGIDVGQGQLVDSLVADPRVSFHEKVNAKDPLDLNEALKDGKFDIVVMDVSFISILKVIPNLKNFLLAGSHLLSLVKPQFELSKKDLNKQGIVKDQDQYLDVKNNVCDTVASLNYVVIDYVSSGIKGGDGNEEFFIYARYDS